MSRCRLGCYTVLSRCLHDFIRVLADFLGFSGTIGFSKVDLGVCDKLCAWCYGAAGFFKDLQHGLRNLTQGSRPMAWWGSTSWGSAFGVSGSGFTVS